MQKKKKEKEKIITMKEEKKWKDYYCFISENTFVEVQ